MVFPEGQVFYNPVQQYNRDLSVSVISAFQQEYFEEKRAIAEKKQRDFIKPKLKILEALSATGLRSIRYAKELDNVEIMANDIDEGAVDTIEQNIQENNVSDKVSSNCGDASLVMYSQKDAFDVIDLDPYGTAAPFLDAAVQSVKDGGLVCVTCTDMAVLCGSYSEACFAKYSSVSLKSSFCHEQALRIILASIENSALKYKRYIVPLVSCSIDFYARVFVRVYSSAKMTKYAASKRSMVYQCHSCKSFELQSLGKITKNGLNVKFSQATVSVPDKCTQCQSPFQIGGPLWNAPLHNNEFILKVVEAAKGLKHLGTLNRIIGMMTVASEELHVPFFYSLSELSNIMHCITPPIVKINSALLNAGYKVSGSHCNAQAIKTNAPSKVIWDIFRCWIKLNPVTMKNISTNSAAFRLLNQETELEADFTFHPESFPESRKIKLLRFQENPEKFWGPKPRAKKLKIN